jgi:hypothetical protein
VRVINIAPGYVKTNIHAAMGISFEQYCAQLGNPEFISAEEFARNRALLLEAPAIDLHPRPCRGAHAHKLLIRIRLPGGIAGGQYWGRSASSSL